MKYNLSSIMKRAWEINKKVGNTFAESLKMAWRIARYEIWFRTKEYRTSDCEKMTFKIWSGYGKVRAYFTCSWFSKYGNNKSTNYIEL